jgi:hypothetical protein
MRLIWSLINLGSPEILESSACVESPVFTLPDGGTWQIMLQPRVTVAVQEGQSEVLYQNSRLAFRAIPNPKEQVDGMKRRIHFSIMVNTKADGSFNSLKGWQQFANFTDAQNTFTLPKFYTMKTETQLKLNHHRQLLITMLIKPEVYFETEEKLTQSQAPVTRN